MPPLTKGKAPVKAAPKPKPEPKPTPPKPERQVLYPKPEVRLCVGDGALTAQVWKDILGWETEKDYTARMLKENPSLKPEAAMFGSQVIDKYGDSYPVLLTDLEGNKVVCWNNAHNRPFDATHAKKIAQIHLNRQWRFNMENVIIGRTGIVESGQHRGVGLILAQQELEGLHGPEKGAAAKAQQASEHWKTLWPSGIITMETSIAFGANESPETLQTLDNVKPRSLSDIFYVSPLFSDLLPEQRNECSRMLQKAVELLWRRTHQGRDDIAGGTYSKYMTHTASMDFVSRHAKVLDCVRFMYDLNKKRNISLLKLSPGQCAAMVYMMAASEDDGDTYRNSDPPREEGLLKFALWKTARSFWVEMAKGDKTNTQFLIVHQALANPVSPAGEAVKLVEKMVILARAWESYAGGQPFGLANVQLTDEDYQVDEHGVKHLQLEEVPTFGGVDAGEPKGKTVNREEVEAEKEKTKAARIEALKAANERRKAKKASGNGSSAEADALQAEIDKLQAAVDSGSDEEGEGLASDELDEESFDMPDDEVGED